jgi:hypothetical protein
MTRCSIALALRDRVERRASSGRRVERGRSRIGLIRAQTIMADRAGSRKFTKFPLSGTFVNFRVRARLQTIISRRAAG